MRCYACIEAHLVHTSKCLRMTRAHAYRVAHVSPIRVEFPRAFEPECVYACVRLWWPELVFVGCVVCMVCLSAVRLVLVHRMVWYVLDIET